MLSTENKDYLIHTLMSQLRQAEQFANQNSAQWPDSRIQMEKHLSMIDSILKILEFNEPR